MPEAYKSSAVGDPSKQENKLAILTDIDSIKSVLSKAKVVAVLGAHKDTTRPSHFVPAYLAENGYEVVPVNSQFEGEDLFGKSVATSLAMIGRPVDVVDVFRRSEALPGHLSEILSMQPRPKVVWFQKGIRNDEVAEQLSNAGIDVVQGRCMLEDHKDFGL
ncbi:MAG: CoA-binding protein [Deltaproteobacteria bacterium CG_4_9_14_3_um_filter_63_12]|nr:MAG: CoA-binding protein [Deltaproteobacteria bacterium CG17_big_fil_post_rev_8_21_14_2_50_63_7]PJB35155.1 MAG: CoA-binding protein [Deltaproteobacteria bacterium CG_4_9_14_3_um_filter_63_12]